MLINLSISGTSVARGARLVDGGPETRDLWHGEKNPGPKLGAFELPALMKQTGLQTATDPPANIRELFGGVAAAV